jgi:hypothetical protein
MFGLAYLLTLPLWSGANPGKSVAFPVKDLEVHAVTKTIKGKPIRAKREGNAINVTIDNRSVPGYYELWFSWATHNQRTGIVWNVKD